MRALTFNSFRKKPLQAVIGTTRAMALWRFKIIYCGTNSKAGSSVTWCSRTVKGCERKCNWASRQPSVPPVESYNHFGISNGSLVLRGECVEPFIHSDTVKVERWSSSSADSSMSVQTSRSVWSNPPRCLHARAIEVTLLNMCEVCSVWVHRANHEGKIYIYHTMLYYKYI